MSLRKLSTFGLTAVAGSLALASASHAAVIDYNFSNATYTGDDTAFLSGGFAWDTTSNKVVSSTIGLTGTVAGFAVSCTNCTAGIFDTEHFAINLGPQALYLTFANSLSNGGSVALSLRAPTQRNEPQYQGGETFSAVTGAAVAVVPEPATWAMMMLGFGMVASAARYRRKSLKVSIA